MDIVMMATKTKPPTEILCELNTISDNTPNNTIGTLKMENIVFIKTELNVYSFIILEEYIY